MAVARGRGGGGRSTGGLGGYLRARVIMSITPAPVLSAGCTASIREGTRLPNLPRQ